MTPSDPVVAQHLERLHWRINYLALRVRIKQELGAESHHDEAERQALLWALRQCSTGDQA